VKDVAFEVDNLDWILGQARVGGGKVVKEVHEEKDENGIVRMASIQTVGQNKSKLIVKYIYNSTETPSTP
jgi:4-hydroxyphenylpyruvate dioxygenase